MVKVICFVFLLWLYANPVFGWLDFNSADVVLNTEDNQFAFYDGPTGQAEWLINNGARTTIRIKGYEDISALKWNLSAYTGKLIEEAELHLCLTVGSDIHALVVSTMNTHWSEGTKVGRAAGSGDSCWRWRSFPNVEWTYKGSDFSTVSFGNFGTLVAFGYKRNDTFKQYIRGGNTWVAMKIPPALIHAMVLDNPGLVVTDPRFGPENGNPRIYSSEQNTSLQPRLLLRVSAETDITPPGDVSELTARSGEWNGEVVLSMTAPDDPEDIHAFGYDIRYGTTNNFEVATEVERWRIPRPGNPGSTNRLLLENLQPGDQYYFWVRSYDKVGNLSKSKQTSLTLPAALATPQFETGPFLNPESDGKQIRERNGIMRYWACSDLAKVNPITGSRLSDGYTTLEKDDYKKANNVWDAATNRIAVHSVRNRMAGFQVIVERLVTTLTGVSLAASDLIGPSGSVIEADKNFEFLSCITHPGGYHTLTRRFRLRVPFLRPLIFLVSIM